MILRGAIARDGVRRAFRRTAPPQILRVAATASAPGEDPSSEHLEHKQITGRYTHRQILANIEEAVRREIPPCVGVIDFILPGQTGEPPPMRDSRTEKAKQPFVQSQWFGLRVWSLGLLTMA